MDQWVELNCLARHPPYCLKHNGCSAAVAGVDLQHILLYKYVSSADENLTESIDPMIISCL